MAVDAPPEKPAGFAVIKVPLIVAPVVPGNDMTDVPAFIIEPADTVSVLEAARPMLKLLVLNRLPVMLFPTAMLPVTLAEVMAALNDAPVAPVLFTYRLKYEPAEKKLIV